MPMTPKGYVPPKTGAYEQQLTCVGAPRCARTGQLRWQAQNEDCSMCRREYVFVEKESGQ